MTAIFELCDEYVARSAHLDPIAAGTWGVTGRFEAATDYRPEGHAARSQLVDSTLARLAGLAVTSAADQLAADHLRERLTVLADWYSSEEPLRDLRAHYGVISRIRDSVDLLPRDTDDHWADIAARLRAVPAMLAGWRDSLRLGAARGLTAARRQAVEAAEQCDRYVETHQPLLDSYGSGALAGELASAAAAAYESYDRTARYLRVEYAPQAADADGVGLERYTLAARQSLGADIDLAEAYQWGWAELDRINAELAEEADRISSGGSVGEAIDLLNQTQFVTGTDAYQHWLQERHDWAVEHLHSRVFDIPESLRTVTVALARDSSAGSAYYTPPSEDLHRPARTWWPLGGRDTFTTWNELAVVFHEGVPGHHLQFGAMKVAAERLSRFAKLSMVSGHAEGWALYAERLADDLGWFTEPGTRLGMLIGSALRAARVVIDIGCHLDLPLPDGSRWTFDRACDVLREQGHAEPHRVHAEIVRYLGWPGQAISYKLGERAWLAAVASARQRPGFSLKDWHTAALNLGPIGLSQLGEALSAVS